MIVQRDEQLLVSHYLGLPRRPVESLQFIELLLGEIKTRPFHVLVTRHPTNWSLASESSSASTIYDPFQHAHVLAEPRPQKLAVGIFAEPIHIEDARSFR